MDNLWEMVAKARGVELNEEFIWKGLRYKVTDYEGLIVLNGSWARSNNVVSFIIGEGKIEKLPFRPQIGDKYYSTFMDAVITDKWAGSTIDYAMLIAGIVFRTKEEAEDYLPTWRERVSKL